MESSLPVIIDHSVPNPPSNVRDETTGLPAAPPSAADVEPQNPKRKRAARSVTMRKARLPIHIVPPVVLITGPDLRIVEQEPYRCESAQKGWDPLSPRWIDFQADVLEGIRLTDAIDTRFGHPDDRDDPMFTDLAVGTSVSCRMEFKGYSACTPRQIVTTNHRRVKSPISREKLVFEVAKCIGTYLIELEEEGGPPTLFASNRCS